MQPHYAEQNQGAYQLHHDPHSKERNRTTGNN